MPYNKAMKKLPIGISTFADIRDKQENYLYVDKTAFACQLIDSGKYYFMSSSLSLRYLTISSLLS